MRDGVIVRAVCKWLNVGVMEHGEVSYAQSRNAPGRVISPLLSNLYLHAVLDPWFEREVRVASTRPGLHGPLRRWCRARLRARRGRAARAGSCCRSRQVGLQLHPEKTRLVLPFGPAGSRTDLCAPGAELRFSRLYLWGGRAGAAGSSLARRPSSASALRSSAQAQWCPAASASPAGRTAGGAEPQAARPPRVLRHHRQQWALKKWNGAGASGCADARGSRVRLGPTSASCCDAAACLLHESFTVLTVTHTPLDRGAGCGSPARPDL